MHHIVSDGWSMGVLFREVAALYEAYAAGEESPLKELRLQYADYAVWQREWLRAKCWMQQLAYWRKQLAGVPPVLELPTDYPRPAVQTFNGAAVGLKLPRRLSEELKALSQQRRRDAVHDACSRRSRCCSIATADRKTSWSGQPIADRTRAEMEDLIGFFVNTLVLRTDLSGNPSFRSCCSECRETALGAYAHQDVPFEKLVEELAARAGPEFHSAVSGDVCNGKYSVT